MSIEDAENIIKFLAKEIFPNTYVNIMDQYFSGKVSEKKYQEVNRRSPSNELEIVEKNCPPKGTTEV